MTNVAKPPVVEKTLNHTASPRTFYNLQHTFQPLLILRVPLDVVYHCNVYIWNVHNQSRN